MSIELITDQQFWDDFVMTNPHSVIFHRWRILKLVERYSGFALLPYGIYDEKNRILGVCPLFLMKRGGLKFVFSQPPKAGIPDTGIVMNPVYYTAGRRRREYLFKTFVQELNRQLIEISPNFISISLLPELTDVREFLWNGFGVNVNYSYVIDIDRDIDEIVSSFDKNCRREIRASEQFNLRIEQTFDTEKFFSIMRGRYHEQHLSFPFFSPEYMKQFLTGFPEEIKCYFLFNDDEIVNLLLTYTDHQRLVFWKGGVNLNKEIHSKEFLTLELIKKAKEERFRELELQGANIERIARYKSKFNPRIEQSFTIEKADLLGRMARRLYLNILKKN